MKKLISILAVVLVLFTINASAQNEYEVKKIGHDTICVSKDTIVKKIGEFSCSPELKQKYGEKKIIEAWLNSRVEVDSKSFYDYSSWGTYRKKIETKTFLIKNENTVVENVPPPIYNAWQFAWKTILFWVIAFVGGFLYTKSLYKTINKTDCYCGGHFIIFTVIAVLTLIGTSTITIAAKSTDSFMALIEYIKHDGAITGSYHNQTFGFICIGIGIVTLIIALLFTSVFHDDDDTTNESNLSNTGLYMGAFTGISIGWFVSITIVTGQWLPLVTVIFLLGIGIVCGYIFEALS